ncbi:MAG TPA: hypothetical protein VIW67_22565 [Terriglobales bacterium]|jgi:hypothetical protein
MTLTNLASMLLTVNDREAVLGDLQEANEGPLQSVRQIFCLALRRQLELWKSWRPWLAAFGLAMPNSFALMGISVSISSASLHFLNPGIAIGPNPAIRNGLFPFLCQMFLLLICSWIGGFVVGSISRSTLWASVMLCASPLLFCLSRFGIQSLSKYCLFLFLPSAILGVRHGLHRIQITTRSAMLFAITVTVSMICLWTNSHALLLDCSLIWPAWYIVATSRPTAQI